jgi:hypothetical protein
VCLKYKKGIDMKNLILMLAIVAIAACSRLQINSDWDTSVDFTPLRNYVLLPNETPDLSPFARERIEVAIDADLETKGFRKVSEQADADMAVGFDIATEDRTSYQTVHSGFGAQGFRQDAGRWGMGMGMSASTSTSRTTQQNYTVGTLLIAVYEIGSKELIWEASASGNLNSSSGQNEGKINSAVQGMLRDFPPAGP